MRAEQSIVDGLHLQRTALAWRRTAFAAIVAVLFVPRLLASGWDPVLAAASLTGFVPAIVLVLHAVRREHALSDTVRHDVSMTGAAFLALGASCALAAGWGIVVTLFRSGGI